MTTRIDVWPACDCYFCIFPKGLYGYWRYNYLTWLKQRKSRSGKREISLLVGIKEATVTMFHAPMKLIIWKPIRIIWSGHEIWGFLHYFCIQCILYLIMNNIWATVSLIHVSCCSTLFLFPSVVCNQIFIDSCQILISNPQVDLVVGLAVILSCLYDLWQEISIAKPM